MAIWIHRKINFKMHEMTQNSYFMGNWKIRSNHSVEILWFRIQFLKFHVKSLLCKCKSCHFDQFEGSELPCLVIFALFEGWKTINIKFCPFWPAKNCPNLKWDSMYLIFLHILNRFHNSVMIFKGPTSIIAPKLIDLLPY